MKKVRYIGPETEDGYTPHPGSTGYVINSESTDKGNLLLIRWDDESVKSDKTWYCWEDDIIYIEKDPPEKIYITKNAVDIISLVLLAAIDDRFLDYSYLFDSITTNDMKNILSNIIEPLQGLKNGHKCEIIMEEQNNEDAGTN